MGRGKTQGGAGAAKRRVSPSGEAGAVRVRLFGGFEVWRGERSVGRFESQKVKALFAYLLCHPGRAFSRDHLAGLLWPDSDPDAARHTLRQALYNLKSALPAAAESPAPLLLADDRGLRLNPAAGVWVDVTAFEEAVRRGRGGDAVDPYHLSTAAQLYRGELLAGFFVKESELFEEWLLAEQERLREAAIDVLRTLVDSYRRRGEHRFGLHYARRLTVLEPLSEEASRDLMRLCLPGGRRSRALAEYERLRGLLRSELGAEPLKETRDLYHSILRETAEEVEVEIDGDAEPIGPLIPLAGRGQALAALLAEWEQACAGRCRVTLVVGEPGTGKTRLIRSFLDVATSQRRAVVLKGRGEDLDLPPPYHLLAEALAGALEDDGGAGERPLAELPPAVLAEVARLLPALYDLRPELPAPTPLADAGQERLFAAVAAFLAALGRGDDGAPVPLVLFLDDLHRADPETLLLLQHLADRAADRPLWLLAACPAGEEGALRGLLAAREGEARGTIVAVDRLPAHALLEIAESLVDEEQAPELSRFLAAKSGGLPLAVAELVNFLWDEGVLVATEGGRGSWRLAVPLAGLVLPGQGVTGLILERIRRLPSSTRRLATLAAVAGPTFDFALLERAGEEHAVVVEVGVETLLKRWLARRYQPCWESGRRRRDLTLWAAGVRRGRFELAHRHIRGALLAAIEPARRRALHAQVAAALEALPGEDGARAEILAHHWAAAGDWSKALSHLERALKKARAVQAESTAAHYFQRALDLLGRLCEAAGTPEQAAATWTAARSRPPALGGR